MNDEFDLLESSQPTFDVKAFLFRALRYWWLFVICIGIGFFIIYQQNIRKQASYRLATQISVEDETNPLFTSNTSLTFNWGGVSGKVNTIQTSLRSRSIHEKVVDSLQFYITYLKQSRFRKDDIYKQAPFKIHITPNTYQVLNIPIQITFLDAETFELSTNFETSVLSVQNFTDKAMENIDVSIGEFKERYKIGTQINKNFFNGKVVLPPNRKVKAGDSYFFKFENFNGVVGKYKSKLVINNPRGSAILNLSMTDNNKGKIVDYLNTTVVILSEDHLAKKNQFVTNTINFIDSQLGRVKSKITSNVDSINTFRATNKVYNIDEESTTINAKLAALEINKDNVNRQLAYYASLKSYLENSQDFTDLPAPSLAGVDDSNIQTNISKINALSVQKANYEKTVRSDASIFTDLNRQINALKRVLIENIGTATSGLNRDLNNVNSKIGTANSKIRKLPKNQQQLLDIQRQYALNEQTYNVFLAKRGEADIIKSASVSDINVIDKAKDTGARPIDLKLSSRYMLAIFGGILPPLLLAFIVTFFDNKLHSPKELEALSNIPMLGVVGVNTLDNSLAVHRKPKSTIAESFRAIRTSLQYMYKKHELEGAKTVMVTSSVSGEGKTFCSINVATVFALSGKKTVLVGLDLRKPKIFGDFNIENDIGAVNYLIGQKNLEEVTQNSGIENLDIITSGPIPPNPSELLISDKMDALILELKAKYDYIILDTPPVGLVADALELLEHADASLYVVRQDYTKKEMLNLINDKHKKKEVKNLSFIYNGYDQKGSYGYGYGYGYGAYGNGYHENDTNKKSVLKRIKNIVRL